MVLSLTAYTVDTGSFPACYTEETPACPAVELCTKHVHYSFVKLIMNFREHFGHFRIIRLLSLLVVVVWSAIVTAFSPAGRSHSLPSLHAGHRTKLLGIYSTSSICSINSISITSFFRQLEKASRCSWLLHRLALPVQDIRVVHSTLLLQQEHCNKK